MLIAETSQLILRHECQGWVLAGCEDVWQTALTHNLCEKVAQLASVFQLCREKGIAFCPVLLRNGHAVGDG